jgi:hypothetical protein
MGITAMIVFAGIKIAVIDHHVAMILVMLVIDIAKKGLMAFEIDFADVLFILVVAGRNEATLVVATLVKDVLEDVVQIKAFEVRELVVAGNFGLDALIIAVFSAIDREDRRAGDAGDAERQATDAKAK